LQTSRLGDAPLFVGRTLLQELPDGVVTDEEVDMGKPFPCNLQTWMHHHHHHHHHYHHHYTA
jgi:hypothetical protein